MSNYQTINASASPEVQSNENMETIEYSTVYGKRQPVTTGLTWGYYGGRWGGNAITAGTLTLTNAADNYIVVARSNGAISVSTSATNWNDTANYARVYKLTTAGSVVTVTEDHRAGLYGVHGPSASTSVAEFKGLTFTSDTDSTADSDPGNGLFKWNNATQASATVLYFDNQTADAQSLTTLWGNLTTAGFIHLQQSDDATKWQLWRWTAAPVDGTGYRKFTVTLQASGGSIADAKTVYATFTNDRPASTFIAPRVTSTASSSTPTPNADTTDVYILTALATGPTFGAPTGSPVQGQALLIRIKDDSTPRALAWNAIYRATDIALPTTTVAGKELYVGFVYDATASKWDLMGTRQVA